MDFCITGKELRRALKDIKVAEKNGFDHCLAVFKIVRAGHMLEDTRAEYSDLIEKAHPTDGYLNWGRFQGVTTRNKFKNGKLVPLK
jgi:hypothetical protein